jgi:aldehyde dehydrogenase (NAD+)
MGPVVSEAACGRILSVIDEAQSTSAGRLVTGGRRLDGDRADGYFVAPTVFADVDPDSSLAQREVFGPVLSVLRFSSEDQVVALANGTPYGLAAYLYTADIGRAQRVARQLETGTVTINSFPSMSPTAPFGGVKQSGFGREGGRAGIDEFLRTKNIVLGG